jgi:hypothetical protein
MRLMSDAIEVAAAASEIPLCSNDIAPRFDWERHWLSVYQHSILGCSLKSEHEKKEECSPNDHLLCLHMQNR